MDDDKQQTPEQRLAYDIAETLRTPSFVADNLAVALTCWADARDAEKVAEKAAPKEAGLLPVGTRVEVRAGDSNYIGTIAYVDAEDRHAPYYVDRDNGDGDWEYPRGVRPIDLQDEVVRLRAELAEAQASNRKLSRELGAWEAIREYVRWCARYARGSYGTACANPEKCDTVLKALDEMEHGGSHE